MARTRRISKPQKKIIEIIKKIFPNDVVKTNYRGFSWLKDKKNLELDILVIRNSKPLVAIEYDGEQHFKPLAYSRKKWKIARARRKFGSLKKRDMLKNRLMFENKDIVPHFIRISVFDVISKDSIINKLIKYGIRV